jgi:hypothetical protein
MVLLVKPCKTKGNMKKLVSEAFGKKIYFLGTGKDGVNYYLQAPSWDCGWYWGFGYVETYTNNKRPDMSRDISSHEHFNGLFFGKDKDAFSQYKQFFNHSSLSDKDIWKLCDFMKSFYTLRDAAEVVGRGYSHFTERAKLETLKDLDMVKMINEVMLPVLFSKIDEMFQGNQND